MTNTADHLGQSRISRAEGLSRQLEADIVNGQLAPGTRMGTKDELKKRFGVALATVNESVRMLETRGLVEARPGPGGGVFVANPSPQIRLSQLVLGFESDSKNIEDCWTVRAALEPPIWNEALHHRTAESLALAIQQLQGMSEAMDDPWEYLRRNWDLHRCVAQMSPNQVLRSIYLLLLDMLESNLTEVAEERVDNRKNLAVHRDLVKAVEIRDAKLLARALARHQRGAGLRTSAG